MFATEPVFQYPNAFDKGLLEAAQRQGGGVSVQNGRLVSYQLRYASVDSVRQSMLALYPSLAIAGDVRSRTVHVLVPSNLQNALRELVERVDVPLRQIQMEVQVIEVGSLMMSQYKSLFSQFESGLQINYDPAAQTLRPAQELVLTLSGLVQNGHAKLMAKPSNFNSAT